MICLNEINSIDQLSSLADDWDRLLLSTERASYFHTLEWLRVYWKHFGADQKLRVLVISKSDEVVGILPLVVRREDRKVGPVAVLTWPLDDWGSFYGPLGPDPQLQLTLGLEHIRDTRRDWDLLDLRWTEADGPLAAATGTALLDTGLTSYKRVRDKTAFVDTRGSWEDYLASRTSKWRNNFRRWKRKLGERGEISFQRYRPAGTAGGQDDPRWDLLEECMEVAEQSWQGASQDGTTISHPEIRDYIRDAHQVAAQLGCLDLNQLRLDGRLIAFAYNYFFRGGVFGLRVGFDPNLGREGAGNLLYCHALEDSFGREDHTYDMGPGSLDCKKYLWTQVVELVQHTHFRPFGIRAQALRWNACRTGEFTLLEKNDDDSAKPVHAADDAPESDLVVAELTSKG